MSTLGDAISSIVAARDRLRDEVLRIGRLAEKRTAERNKLLQDHHTLSYEIVKLEAERDALYSTLEAISRLDNVRDCAGPPIPAAIYQWKRCTDLAKNALANHTADERAKQAAFARE